MSYEGDKRLCIQRLDEQHPNWACAVHTDYAAQTLVGHTLWFHYKPASSFEDFREQVPYYDRLVEHIATIIALSRL